MDKKTEALKLALAALEQIDEAMPFPVAKLAQAVLREALAEQPAQQQEPLLQEIARLHDRIKDLEMDVEFLLSPANTSAGQRSVKQLTSEEILEIGVKLFGDVKNGPTIRHSMKFVRAIEAKLKEKNT